MPVDKTTKAKGEYGVGDEAIRKIFLTLCGILIAYAIVFVGTLIRNNIVSYGFIGQAPKNERTILVEADGRAVAVPDVALVTMGVLLKAPTVAEVQEKTDAVIKTLAEKVKILGVDPKDIQTTNYTIYPKTKWTEEKGEEPDGFEASEQVTIKVRDLSKAGAVLALAGDVGANTVQGMQFKIDDPEKYRNEARVLALRKAQEKAAALSRALGVSVVRVVSYNEFEVDGKGFDMLYRATAEGMGGGGAAPVESGSMDITMRVLITYEIR
jgi:hypothetical protein